MIKHHDQTQVGEERVYLAYTSTSMFIIKGSQDRNSKRTGTCRQELMQKPWRGAAYWLAPKGLFCLFSCRTRVQQPMEWYHSQWAGPSPISHQLRNRLRGLPAAQSYGGVVSIEVPIHQMTLVYYEAVIKLCNVISLLILRKSS